MIDITFERAQDVGGGFTIGGWAVSQLFTAGVTYAFNAVVSGRVDYAGVAEAQGTYYNMVGA